LAEILKGNPEYQKLQESLAENKYEKMFKHAANLVFSRLIDHLNDIETCI